MGKDAKIRELEQRVIELEKNLHKADAILAEMHAKTTEGGETIEALENTIASMVAYAKKVDRLAEKQNELLQQGRMFTLMQMQIPNN